MVGIAQYALCALQVACSAGRVHGHTQGRNKALLHLHNQDAQACAFWVELTLLQAAHEPAERHSSSAAAASDSTLHCCSLRGPADEQHTSSSPDGQAQTAQQHHRARQRVLPVWWSDNYVTLGPGEAVSVDVCWRGSAAAVVEVQGWNAAHQLLALSRDP